MGDLKLILFGILISAILILLMAPDYQYNEVVVLGADAHASAEIASFIPRGTSALFFPYAAVREALLRSNPSLLDVRIAPSLFGILRVYPVWRNPVLTLNYKGHSVGLDEKGITFPLRDFHRTEKQIELQKNVDLTLGEPLPPPFGKLAIDLVPVLESFRPGEFSRIVLDRGGELRLFTKDHVNIRVGSPEGLAERLRILSPILRVIRNKRIKAASIDLRSEKMPVIKVDFR